MRRSASFAAVLCTVTLASSPTVHARPPKPPEVNDPPQVQCRSLDEGAGAARAGWGRADRTNGCFFFSGPHDLGRDDHLGAQARYEVTADRVVVHFGQLTFSGRLSGDRVQLRRVSNHEFGSTWRVTETIEARFVQERGCRILRGTYHYQECDTAGNQCPGGCTIDAPVRITAR